MSDDIFVIIVVGARKLPPVAAVVFNDVDVYAYYRCIHTLYESFERRYFGCVYFCFVHVHNHFTDKALYVYAFGNDG